MLGEAAGQMQRYRRWSWGWERLMKQRESSVETWKQENVGCVWTTVESPHLAGAWKDVGFEGGKN